MRYLVFLLLISVPIGAAEVSTSNYKWKDTGHVCREGVSTAGHRCLPQRQGNAVLVDSGCGYSAWTNINHCLTFEPTLGALQYANRCCHGIGSGQLNVHQTDATFSFWVHDEEVYQYELGPARNPSSVASYNNPYISFPTLDIAGNWGHMCAQRCEGGWFSSSWASPMDMSGDIGTARTIGVELPTGNIVFIGVAIDAISYYTMAPDLSTTVASGYLTTNGVLWGIDCNDGICYVFWRDPNDVSVWYVTTTDGITWTPVTEWALAYPSPYTDNYLGFCQMAVTDAGSPILVFNLSDANDYTYPWNSKTYVSTASGATPVEVSDNTYGVWSYPTIAAGGGELIVVMQVAMDTTLMDSFTRHDIFCCASTDGGITWGSAVNLTEGVTNRPGLPQCAKRVDATSDNFFYFYGINRHVDFDPFYMLALHSTGLPCEHYWYVGWHEIPTGITEHDRKRPPKLAQLEISPNPFKHLTDIRYQITDIGYREIGGSVINIFDATGCLVKTFHPAPDALRFAQRWYGDDNSGRQVPPGIYFVRLENNESKVVKKIVKLE